MSDQIEEQEMEAEALEAIYESAFEVVAGDVQPFQWSVTLWPSVDESEDDHVGIKLLVKVPPDYPEHSLADLDIEILKGLTDAHRVKLLDLANEECQANEGMPQIYAVTEVLKEWLVNNNEAGQADDSMHAQMLRRAKEEAEKKKQALKEYESQKVLEELTEAEAEEQAVRKRRAEGTPCNTMEAFLEWKMKFDAEMAQQALLEKESSQAQEGSKKKGGTSAKMVDKKAGRLTGFQHFQGTGAVLDSMEEAAEAAEAIEMTAEELEEAGFEEDLFLLDDDDDDDDIDLDLDDDDDDDLDDDLDFDDDDDDEPDI